MEIDYDFDGSLHIADVVEDYFYSPSTGLYVHRHPLIVDARLLEAADRISLRVTASPEKWLVNVTLADGLRLLKQLGSAALSLPEYWNVRRDAILANDRNMLASLESDQFIEMLATVFIHDRTLIHHPDVDGPLSFSGSDIPVETPAGRYGWVHPDDIDLNTGLPTRVGHLRNVRDETIKYWDTHTEIGRDGVLMTVRGFVASVGKISLDLGFPADAISQKLTIRECRRARPGGTLDSTILDEAKGVLAEYHASAEDESLFAREPKWRERLLAFLESNRASLSSANDIAGNVLKEEARDALGMLWTCALTRGEHASAEKFCAAAKAFSGLSDVNVSDAGFLEFLRERRVALRRAVAEHGSIVFVMGHNNPDTDAIVSAIAEAYRQNLMHGGESTFVPVVPGDRIPDEVVELLGAEISGQLVRSADTDYAAAAGAGRPEWIMVDHNIGREQPDTRAIIDHHYPSAVCLRQQIPRRIIFAGSTSALVAQRIYGLGLEIPRTLARILHGATLMDTENRFHGKMTPLDERIMDRLRGASGMSDDPSRDCPVQKDESAFYRRLMRRLITCPDAETLFIRDYKEDWSFFGFAVAKGIGILSAEKTALIRRLQELAAENNRRRNLPLTLVKVVDYADDAQTITRERAYPVFSEGAAPEFCRAVRETIVTIIRHESPKSVRIEERDDHIEYGGVGTQLSRKKLAPVLDPVVTAFNRFFFSTSAGFYFKRDFLRLDSRVEEVARRHGITLTSDEDGVVVGNPAELKFLLQELGFECASPAEYWKVWSDAVRIDDQRMVAHLTSSRYLETLDMIVEKKEILVEHPLISRGPGGYAYSGGIRRTARVPVGEPGLFDPRKIDPATGLPTEVEDPRQYGRGLWRYWSPDSACSWVLRSTIFAYDIPSLDLKFDFREALPRLTIRPCVREVKHPRVRVTEKQDRIVVDIVDMADMEEVKT